ncbi:MAG TPA: hypothetical protein PLM07_11495 [Candidatus Rifleibacterium sp.]|nr:hypothetical protein [Candidatus Rifleibacterium sp.]HPT46514.1 hypothetical protein [Candidatus Rifleibacterium sp.]
MRAFNGLLVSLAVFLANPAAACELPAHPSAAAIPKKGTPGMMLVEEGKNFYYLVEEGTTAQMKIVWDPAMHNRPSGLNTEEYDGIVKEKISADTEVDNINGAGFFEVSAMSEFFKVKGNRGDLKEAFERESGADLDQDYVSDLSLGPTSALETFAKGDQKQEFSVAGGTATGYTDSPDCDPKTPDPLLGAADADNVLPNRKWLAAKETITLEGGATLEKRFFTLPSGDKVEIHDCGIYMKDLTLAVTEIEPEKYKAFIYGSNKATTVLTDGITYDPDTTGAVGPEFSMTFTTPTIGADKDDSLLKVKVESPPAGYDFSNIFWVWQEDLYKYTEKTVSEPKKKADGTPELDAAGNPVMEDVTKAFYEPPAAPKKCSTGLKMVVYKPAASQGFSAFRVYDTEGPVSSEFNVGTPVFSASGSTSVDFSMKVADSNPFADVLLSEKVTGKDGTEVDLTQSLAKLGLEVFYSYPTYKYKAAAANSFEELAGKGLADLADAAGNTPTFKTYTHETQWFWKKADVAVNSITRLAEISQTTAKCGDRVVGASYEIKGTFTIKNPKPWHEYSDAMKFSLFAMCKDSRGNPCPLYNDVVDCVNANLDKPLDSAKIVEKPEWAFNPANKNTLAANDQPVHSDALAAGAGLSADNWQKIRFIAGSDNVAPEIEVFVFDTRTNRYHVFGTDKDVAGGLNKLANHYLTDYASLASPPYLTREAEITASYKFTDFTNLSGLFDKYLQGPDAVSLVKTPGLNGFVCQKNSRLIFYARAFDNQGYMASDAGISTFNVTLADKHESKSESAMLNPLDHVFRYENVDADGAVSPYTLTVTAADKQGNNRQLDLNIAVLGRTLEIRTLEERRNRID